MGHQYYGIESLALTAAQRNTLVAHLRSLGPTSSPQPCKFNHARIRLDNLALIVEAEFDAATITALAIRNRLATIFSVAQASITFTTPPTVTAWGPMVTYRYNNVDRLRLIAFGGVDADYGTSWQAVTAYLAANRAEWEAGE